MDKRLYFNINRLTVLFALLISVNAFSQKNLVPNSSFELYTNCPDDYSQIKFANEWTGYPLGLGEPTTPDYYNACGKPSFRTPDNIRGNQPAFEGVAYASINAYNEALVPDNKNEFLGCKLTEAMQIGVTYNVSFMVCLTENSKYGIKEMGMRFFTVDPNVVNQIFEGVPADVNSTKLLTETNSWMQITGTFTPTTLGIQYIAIGNFGTLLLTTKTIVNANRSGAHYFIDDVKVTTDTIPTITAVTSFIKASPIQNICIGDCVSFQDSAQGNPKNYTWNFIGSKTPVVKTQNPGMICYDKPGIYDVTLIVNTNQFFDTFTYKKIINVNKAPKTYLGNDTLIKLNSFLSLDARTNDSSSGKTYLWSDGVTQPVNIIRKPGTYTVTVSNNCGSDIDTILVKQQLTSVFVSDAFSPNGDGINDTYQLNIADLKPTDFSLQIQDRWGKLIQKFEDPSFQWNGKDKQGIECENGIYFGKIYYKTADDLPQTVDTVYKIYITR